MMDARSESKNCYAVRYRTSLWLAAVAAAAVLGSATSASALSFYFVIVSGSPVVGSSLTLDLMVDADDRSIQFWSNNVRHVGNTASAASGEPFVLAGGVLASPLGSVAPGTDQSGQWAYTVSPPGSIPAGTAPFKYGSIHFVSLSPGVIEMVMAPGGPVCSGICLPDPNPPHFDSITVAPIPEPGTACLVGVGLVGLAVARRSGRCAGRRPSH